MSIVTKTGDKGTTAFMFGRRVMKCHARVEAGGAVDELTATLGLARAGTRPGTVCDQILAIQKDLVILMGEVGVPIEDLDRYVKAGYALVTPEMTSRLEGWIMAIEAELALPKDWAIPGANQAAAVLDVARTVCRRAERRVCVLQERGELRNGEVIIYLNRLADLLWLMARRAEKES